MTPCQRRGYEVGDLFVVTAGHSCQFPNGSVVCMVLDDEDTIPKFGLVVGETDHQVSGIFESEMFMRLDGVKKIEAANEEEQAYLDWFKDTVQQGNNPLKQEYRRQFDYGVITVTLGDKHPS